MNLEIMFLILNLMNDMLPIRSQHIPVLSLQSIRDILKRGIELCCRRDIPALGNSTRGTEMAAIGRGVVGEGRRLRSHLLGPWGGRSGVVWIHNGECETLFRP
jgi:hypothetical protein